jgi:hypothetical protein
MPPAARKFAPKRALELEKVTREDDFVLRRARYVCLSHSQHFAPGRNRFSGPRPGSAPENPFRDPTTPTGGELDG